MVPVNIENKQILENYEAEILLRKFFIDFKSLE